MLAAVAQAGRPPQKPAPTNRKTPSTKRLPHRKRPSAVAWMIATQEISRPPSPSLPARDINPNVTPKWRQQAKLLWRKGQGVVINISGYFAKTLFLRLTGVESRRNSRAGVSNRCLTPAPFAFLPSVRLAAATSKFHQPAALCQPYIVRHAPWSLRLLSFSARAACQHPLNCRFPPQCPFPPLPIP